MHLKLVLILRLPLAVTNSIQRHHSHWGRSFRLVHTSTFPQQDRCVFWPSEAPASWPPRPALTPLGGRCVAGHLVPGYSSPNGLLKPNGNHSQSFNYPFRDMFVCPISSLHLAVGDFPKLETGMNPAHKLAYEMCNKVYKFETRYISSEIKCIQSVWKPWIGPQTLNTSNPNDFRR